MVRDTLWQAVMHGRRMADFFYPRCPLLSSALSWPTDSKPAASGVNDESVHGATSAFIGSFGECVTGFGESIRRGPL